MSNYAARLAAIRELNPLPNDKQKSLDITAIKKGGFLELDNQTWQVANVFQYLDVKWGNFKRRKSDYWMTELELFSLNTGETRYLEWEFDDELEICQSDALVKMRDIQFNGKTLSRADLEYIADEEEGEVSYKGQRYAYSEADSWAGLFMKSRDDKNGTPMRTYEFEADNEKCLSIETWHEDDDDRPEREAFLSHQINANQISILQIQASINS